MRAILLGTILGAATTAAGIEINFEDLSLSSESAYTGADMAGGFESGGVHFNNSYIDWGGGVSSWDGFAVATHGVQTVTDDDINMGLFWNYELYTAAGGALSGNAYGIGFVNNFGLTPEITLPSGYQAVSISVTNTLWTWASMTYGDAFSKKFGTGDDPNDWFLLTIEGLDASGELVGSTEFYLADFRFEDPELDYIVDDWETVDLTTIGSSAEKLRFTLTTSDMGVLGPNTPLYFAVDNLVVVPEPSTWAGLVGVAVLAAVVVRRRRYSKS